MGLIRKIFWVLLTFVFAFFFSILFEHGTDNFQKNVESEFKSLKKLVERNPKPTDKSDSIPAK